MLNEHSLVEKALRSLEIDVDQSINLENFPYTGRGVQAIERVQKGKKIFHINSEWLVTPRFVIENLKEASYFCEAAGRLGRNVDAFDLLTLWIVTESTQGYGKKSKFEKYFETLPIKYSVPYFLPEKYQKLLTTQVRTDVEKELNNLYDRHEKFTSIRKNIRETYHREIISECSWIKFRWAAATIKTRQIYIYDEKYNDMKIEGLEIGTPFDSSGLAPWFDMLNHGDVGHVNCKFYCMSPEKGLICEAIRDILTGEQLLISYDERSDDQMLVDYGFSLGAGENQLTFLKLTLREIIETIELHTGRYLETLFDKFAEHEIAKSLTSLKIFQTGPQCDVVPFLVELMPHACPLRNKNDLEIEALKIMELMMIKRIAEIEQLDELETREFKNDRKYPGAVDSFRTLRQSHKFIAERELERLDNLNFKKANESAIIDED